MIGRASAQAADVAIDVLVCAPAKALIGCGQSAAVSRAVLEVNACGQAVGSTFPLSVGDELATFVAVFVSSNMIALEGTGAFAHVTYVLSTGARRAA